MLSLERGERLWFQILLLRKRDPDWLPGVQKRLKLEMQHGYVVSENGHPLSTGSEGGHLPKLEAGSIGQGFAFLLVTLCSLLLATFFVQGVSWSMVGVGAGVIAIAGTAWRLLGQREDPWISSDPAIIGRKVLDQEVFFEVLIRASVWTTSYARAGQLLSRIEDGLGGFSLAGGNRFVPVPDPYEGQGLWPRDAFHGDGHTIPLGAGEVAALWHIPAVEEGLAPGQVPISGVEIRAPDPQDVQGFYELGKSFHGDGSAQPVFLSETALERNSLLIGKPGTGKTNTMIHLALAAMRHPDHPALVVVDPHGDMADQLSGAIDPIDRDRVRILDLSDTEFALTLNPLDPHREGWDVLSSANSIVDIGKALWGVFWGPRMQDPAKNCLKLLAAANEGRDREDLLGLSLLGELVGANQELYKQFIGSELEDSQYRDELSRWSFNFFHKLTKYRREDMILSVLYKAHRFAERPMLHLFSCPKSMLDLGQLIRERQVLIINTQKSHFGADVSDFAGSLLINLVLRQIARQGEQTPDERTPVVVIVDEFQSFTGVGWKEALGETRKHGGRFIVGTQNFASLRGGRDTEDLRGEILGAVQPLFVFQTNGEDAEYLSRHELSGTSGGPSPSTLTNLERYRAYVRLVRDDGRVTHPFYFETAPPPEVNLDLAEEVRSMRATYSLRYEQAVSAAERMLAYLDRYGRTLLTQGDSGSGRGKAEATAKVRRAMLHKSGEDRATELEVRRALLGEGEKRPDAGDLAPGTSTVFADVSPEMLELLEAKLMPDDDPEDDDDARASDE
jgi:hypothetical protein